MDVNRHGLKRDIPDLIKLAVRQRCGFGCVVCGNPFIQYDHFNPEFWDATSHEAKGITLLCGSCHDKKTKKIYSQKFIEYHNLNPYALTKGIAWGQLDIGMGVHPVIKLGGNTFINCYNVIQVFNENLIQINPPQNEAGIFSVNINLKDKHGKQSLAIINNEVIYAKNWDVNWVGPILTMRSGNRAIDLVLELNTPNIVCIKRLNMRNRDYRFIIDKNIFEVKNKEKKISMFKMNGNTSIGMNPGILFDGEKLIM